MGKNLFENITDGEASALEWILKNENSTPADFFFSDPTIDGRIFELKKYELVKEDVTGTLKITELGRSALKEYKQIVEQRSNVDKQREDELSSFKAIADAAQSQSETAKAQAELAISESESAKKDSRYATILSVIAIIVSIAAIIVPLIFG